MSKIPAITQICLVILITGITGCSKKDSLLPTQKENAQNLYPNSKNKFSNFLSIPNIQKEKKEEVLKEYKKSISFLYSLDCFTQTVLNPIFDVIDLISNTLDQEIINANKETNELLETITIKTSEKAKKTIVLIDDSKPLKPEEFYKISIKLLSTGIEYIKEIRKINAQMVYGKPIKHVISIAFEKNQERLEKILEKKIEEIEQELKKDKPNTLELEAYFSSFLKINQVISSYEEIEEICYALYRTGYSETAILSILKENDYNANATKEKFKKTKLIYN